MSVLVQAQTGAVRTLRLNRPEKLNAFDAALQHELRAGLDAAAADASVRVLVLTGSGRAFSTGADVDELVDPETGAARPLGALLREGFNPIVMTLRTMEKPVIAAINGVVAGIGFSIALACDMRIAAAEARLTLGFARLGLIPDGGATVLLPQVLGLGRALELAWTNRTLTADDAQRLGLVNSVVPVDDLEREVQAFAQQLAEVPATALALTKRAFTAAVFPNLAEVLEREAVIQEEAARSPDLVAAVRAFRERGTQR